MKKWIGREKEKICIILLAGILLLVIAVPTEQDDEQAQQDYNNYNNTEVIPEAVSEEEALEMRLEKILRTVDGIGEVQVMVTLKSDGKKLVEKDVRILASDTGENAGSGQDDYEETTVYQRDSHGNESPFVSEKTEPEVTGVLVAAQGAENAWVASEIIEAVKALFGTEVHKIKVMKMK